MTLKFLFCTPHINSENRAHGSTLAGLVPLEAEISIYRCGVYLYSGTHRREARGDWSQSWFWDNKGWSGVQGEMCFHVPVPGLGFLQAKRDYLLNMYLFRIKWSLAKMPLENSESRKGDNITPKPKVHIHVSLWYILEWEPFGMRGWIVIDFHLLFMKRLMRK